MKCLFINNEGAGFANCQFSLQMPPPIIESNATTFGDCITHSCSRLQTPSLDDTHEPSVINC